MRQHPLSPDAELRRALVASILVRTEGLMTAVERDLVAYCTSQGRENPERLARTVAAELGECLDQFVAKLRKRELAEIEQQLHPGNRSSLNLQGRAFEGHRLDGTPTDGQ